MATVAHAKAVYALTASTAPSGANLIDGIDSAELSESRTVIETSDYASAEFKTRIMGLRDATISLSGQLELSDTAQALLRTNYAAGTTTHITILYDGTNGFTFPCVISSYNVGGGVDEANTFSCECLLNGAPISRP